MSREAELQCFAEQLATAFAAERETHDETKKQLDKEKKKRLALQQTLESMQVDWSTKKQSWHLSHKKHLRLREKYNKLLKIVPRDMTHAEERAATRAAAQPERPEACTPEAFWNMGFSDDDGGAADPFDMAPSEYRASRSAPPVKAKMRMTVAVESEPIDDYEGGRFGRSGTRNHGRGRHAAPPVTPTVAHLSLGF